LADGVIDLALLARPIEAKYLSLEDLFEEELLLVMSPENPLRRKKHVRLEDIEHLPFVLLNEAHCLTDNVLNFCRSHAVNPVSIERTSQIATVQELVSLNHGVSLIPAMARAMDTSGRRLYRSLHGTKPTRRVVVVWNPYRFQSRLLETFRFRIIQHCRTGRFRASKSSGR
jgi:LysR family hydrogen peroxide-inducible transcriptional activator